MGAWTSAASGRAMTIRAVILSALLLMATASAAADEKASADHWAWKPAVRAALPAVKDTDWVRNPIDAFILARIEAQRLRPAAEVDRTPWIRRVTYDLTG